MYDRTLYYNIDRDDRTLYCNIDRDDRTLYYNIDRDDRTLYYNIDRDDRTLYYNIDRDDRTLYYNIDRDDRTWYDNIDRDDRTWTIFEKVVDCGLYMFVLIDGCSSLKCASKIDASQAVLLDALRLHEVQTRPDQPHMFAKMLTALAEVRQTAHEEERSIERMFKRWPDLQYPPMLVELLAA